ncbi:hypothetical protein [Marinisporobacter balticus]|uniref:NurA domain-containing protein n=1 Tax=Marinisporobacter balticus TaxID=2018667 RepID=A0A4R2K825_9FIRM|nr:hypothetical protein [Marinisporobacter balticus]TCO68734.1 hypothetical protein EV214_14113 [Marinisporobacter balticus]
MSRIMTKIAEETNGKSFKTFKYSFDSTDMPSFDYDDNSDITWERMGETVTHKKAIDLSIQAKKIATGKPAFTYFLDGSRRAFKVDDIAYRNQVYPVIAGQIGIGCCKRENKEMKPFDFEKRLVIALPKVANQDDWNKKLFFKNLLKKVNMDERLSKEGIEFTDIIPYSCKKDEAEKMENKGIAVIQDLMVEKEKMMVAKLASKNLLSYDSYLLKDGSLEYRVVDMKNEREVRNFKNNYRWVIGASKSFNPENCKDHKGKNNSNLIVDLKLYHRTPVNMYSSPRIGNMKFAVWYVRIRDKIHTSNAFDGILKLEKILVTDEQIANGVDTEEVDWITANIINERNPVCYGDDFRWANHLYPVYVTERYVKSKYISNTMFLNLF